MAQSANWVRNSTCTESAEPNGQALQDGGQANWFVNWAANFHITKSKQLPRNFAEWVWWSTGVPPPLRRYVNLHVSIYILFLQAFSEHGQDIVPLEVMQSVPL